MIRITADDKIPFLRDSPLAEFAEITYLPGAKISAADVKNADALITRTRTKCNAELLDGSRVKFIATATIGFDHIDTEYCAAHGIVWKNAPGCNASSVGQYLASVLTNLPFEPKGRTLGVIGVGHVGREVEKTALALGMRVLRNDPPRAAAEGPESFTELEELLAESDVVTLHTPLEKDGPHPTFHLADGYFFSRMKRSAYFINAARGSVCDNAVLKEALRAKVISGAVLDVWEGEPAFDRELQKLLLAGTPHIAGYSTDGKANGTAMSVRALADFFKLPIPEWKPVPPSPEAPEIRWTTLADAVRRSYDVFRDDAALREEPEAFERLRGNYRLRREFGAFHVTGCSDPSVRGVLAGLGFRMD